MVLDVMFEFAAKEDDGKLSFERALVAFFVKGVLENGRVLAPEDFKDVTTIKPAAVARFDEQDMDSKMSLMEMVCIAAKWPELSAVHGGALNGRQPEDPKELSRWLSIEPSAIGARHF